MRMSYGFDDMEKNQQLINDAEILMSAFSEAAFPGRYLVNNLPLLKYVPSWFPGAGWKRFCKYIATVNQKVLYDSFEDVKKNLVRAVACLARIHIIMLSLEQRYPKCLPQYGDDLA